jgi:hypothetical protein
MIETEAAQVRACADAVVEVLVREGAIIELPQMQRILDAQLQLNPGPVGIFVDIRPIRSMSREAMQVTANAAADRDIRAAALVVEGPVSVLLGNFFLKLSPPKYPTRLFRDADEARGWLLAHLEGLR